MNSHALSARNGLNAPYDRARLWWFGGVMVILLAAFALPLWRLVRFAAHANLHSHILLIPFISAYLWRIKSVEAAVPFRSSRGGAAVAAFCGTVLLVCYWVWGQPGEMRLNDRLTLSTASFLFFAFAAALATVGWPILRSRLFAICFLVFMIPLPFAVTDGLSVFLQHASADVSNVTLRLTGMPVLRNGLLFRLPGLSILVAEECSGIRSTLVLFITSVLASYLFLRTGWKRALLALAVFPLGILRNALRITVISWLTVNVDPGIIHGPVHHRGGPVFFALSLIPLFALLWALRRSESASKANRA